MKDHLRFVVVSLIILSVAPVSPGKARKAESRMFNLEGHGKVAYWIYPDDEVRRITAVHDVVTPHIEWAQPLAAGPVKVLAIANKEKGRWPVELAQRFDFDVTTVYCHNRKELGSPQVDNSKGLIVQSPTDVAARLLQAMTRPIDVVINEIPMSTLGPEVAERLMSLLPRGVGYVGPTEGMDLTAYTTEPDTAVSLLQNSVPVAGLRLLAREFGTVDNAAPALLKTWQSPQGRLADMDAYPRDKEYPDANRLQYLHLVIMEEEAWLACMGRSALWACGRLQATALQIDWPAEPVQRTAMPYTLKVSGNEADQIRLRVWDADGQLRHQGNDAVLPVLPAGRFFIGVQAYNDGQVADWALGTIQISADVTIANIELDAKHKRPSQQIQATIHLQGTIPPATTAVLEVLDNYGRSVAIDQRAATAEMTWRAPLEHSLHLYNFLNVRLLDDAGRAIAEDRTAFHLIKPAPPHDDLHWMTWQAGSLTPRIRNRGRQFARMGFDAVLTGHKVNAAVDAALLVDAHPILFPYYLNRVKVDDQNMMHPCVADQEYRRKNIADLKQKAEEMRNLSPLLFYLGDDVQYVPNGADAGWSPSYRAVLTQWARKRYGSLEQINAAWASEFGRLEDIVPIKRAEMLQRWRHGDPGPLRHWLDHQLCTDALVTGWYREMSQAIREVTPNVRANMGSCVVGWTWPGSGIDFWGLAEGKELAFQYPNPWVHDIFRCAAAKTAYHGTWYGGYGTYCYEPYLDQDFLPWWGVFRGINLHGIFYGGQDSRFFSMGVMASDLGPIGGARKIFKNLKELKAGPAKLLFNAERLSDGIALVHSPESLHASVIFNEGLPKSRHWNGMPTGDDDFIYMQCWEGLSYLVRDMGFDHDVLPAKQIADGALQERGIKVLVLPLQTVLHDDQAESIREFVAAGGVLISEALCGAFDGRMRRVEGGVLQDVLGLRFAGKAETGSSLTMQTITTADGEVLGDVAADGGVRLAGAQAIAHGADGVPAVTVHQYDRGVAIHLNLLSREYQIWRTQAGEMAFRDTIAKILADHVRLQPPINCQVGAFYEEESHRLQATEIHRYQLGTGNYIGVLRHHKLRPDESIFMGDLRPKTVWMTLPEKAHVYDMRRRMYRGFTDKVEDIIYPARTELYALLPYEVVDMELDLTFGAGAMHCEGQIVAGTDGEVTTHVYHLEFTEPTGRERPELARNVLAPKGRLAENVFLGYNAPAGDWRVTVCDVASGMTREVRVMVPEGTEVF